MENRLSQSHLHNSIFVKNVLLRNTHLSPISPKYFCPADKEYLCFLILHLPASAPNCSFPAGQLLAMRVICVQFCLTHKFQISRLCVGVLASCFNSCSLFPLFLCCLSLKSLCILSSMPPRIPDSIFSQHWMAVLETFMNTASDLRALLLASDHLSFMQ